MGIGLTVVSLQGVAEAVPNTIFQSAARRRAEAADRAEAEDTRRKLAEAEARGAVERARLRREEAEKEAIAARAQSLIAAGPQEPTVEERQMVERSEAQLQQAFVNLSDEAKQRIEQPPPVVVPANAPAGLGIVVAQAPAAPGNPATPPPPTNPSAGAPKPQPLKPTPIDDGAAKIEKTVITCTGASFFDAAKSIGIFTENVRVYHPQFYLECDELEVFMAKAEDEAKPVAAADPGAAGEKKGEEVEQSSIDKVIARGAMVVIEKFQENGEDIQVGKCKNLTYDGKTGMVTLRVWPQVQRGARVQIADEAGTVMTINPQGVFQSKGRSRTEIIQGEAAKPQTKGLRRAPEQ
jgi:lipopolysaccharide export system protein LptA